MRLDEARKTLAVARLGAVHARGVNVQRAEQGAVRGGADDVEWGRWWEFIGGGFGGCLGG